MKNDPAADSVPKPIYLKDYKAPPYKVPSISLHFDLHDEKTVVISKALYTPQGQQSDGLFLDGEASLVYIQIACKEVPYKKVKGGIFIEKGELPKGEFELEVKTLLNPEKNTSLSGLYKSSGSYCTQCEAEGFRNITYFQDRPDVMSRYETTIEADKKEYPVLLSNGNCLSRKDLPGGRHRAVWQDPWPKPCYLFALVAGDLSYRESIFVTASKREVTLRIYTKEHHLDKTGYAMESLRASMKWDEDRFGLEYDLDLFNIVAVDDFNFGAMENKSLNIFNSRLVLASKDTATDLDYHRIEGVVGHEYFHNWTGNRVTCRDWFQLSLKEGLTVFRDQEFSADMNSAATQRIEDVRVIRQAQFLEDGGPLAHPVRPEKVVRFDNIYTKTIYEKGAEVIRMLHTLLGEEGFRKGIDLYFKRHDGQAVTCDDFVCAMEDANNEDLGQFRLWYSQAGTPSVTVSSCYDAAKKTFSLTLCQHVPDTPDMKNKKPMVIPVKVGLLDENGLELSLDQRASKSAVLRLAEKEQVFVFENIEKAPVPSILRGFSAPVKLHFDQEDSELVFLLCHDSDLFNRYEAAQKLLLSRLKQYYVQGLPEMVDEGLVRAFSHICQDKNLDKAFVASAFSIPTEGNLIFHFDGFDPDKIHKIREFFKKSLAKSLQKELWQVVKENTLETEYSPDASSKARRSLLNTALYLLAHLKEESIKEHCLLRYKNANNMTEKFGALLALEVMGEDGVIEDFYEHYKSEPLVLLKLYRLIAGSSRGDTKKRILSYLERDNVDLKNPNTAYALIGGFAESCLVHLHAKDGSGYRFLGEMTKKLDNLNPHVSARVVQGFRDYAKLDKDRKVIMKEVLEDLLKSKISANAYEIVDKILQNPDS